MPIHSMTGFARSQVRVPLPNEGQLSYTLTVKTVNHRFLDVQLRLPSGLDAMGVTEAMMEKVAGEALKDHCDRLLKQAEAKVEKLTLGAGGTPTGTEPFSAE